MYIKLFLLICMLHPLFSVEVTFQVDMQNETISSDGVSIWGFWDYIPHEMSQIGSSSTYTYTTNHDYNNIPVPDTPCKMLYKSILAINIAQRAEPVFKKQDGGLAQ